MKTLIAMPCMDTVQTTFMLSLLGMRPTGEIEFTATTSSLIYDARNILAKKAMTGGFDRVLWLDTDVVFEPDLFTRLSKHLDDGLEYISALYFKRKDPIEPVIYDYVGMELLPSGEQKPTAKIMRDYPKGLFEVEATGMGAVMMTTELIDKVAREYGLPFSPALGFGEDLSFCMRARQLNVKLYCDSTIKLGHIRYQTVTEEVYKLIQKGIEK